MLSFELFLWWSEGQKVKQQRTVSCSELDIPDNIFNWLVDFLTGHSHQTHYGDSVSQIKSITASIIQGSALGPTSYVVTASDLHRPTTSNGNELCKYADDTCLIIPAVNVNTISIELQHILDWATCNNLSLNLSKCEEIIFVDKRNEHQFNIPWYIRQVKTCAKYRNPWRHIHKWPFRYTSCSTFGHLQCPFCMP